MATLGEKRVLIGFNPAGDNIVDDLKIRFAALIDDIIALPNTNSQTGRWKSLAISHIEDASYYGVKSATAGQDPRLDDGD